MPLNKNDFIYLIEKVNKSTSQPDIQRKDRKYTFLFSFVRLHCLAIITPPASFQVNKNLSLAKVFLEHIPGQEEHVLMFLVKKSSSPRSSYGDNLSVNMHQMH